MSGKVQNKLLSRSFQSNQHTLIHNRSHTYISYQEELQINLGLIMEKYPLHDRLKVRELLEEINNNRELAFDLLGEEEWRNQAILQQKKVQGKRSLQLSKDEENTILKQSFLNLYKKRMTLQKEKQQLQKKNQALRQENAKLKQMNSMLLQQNQNKHSFLDQYSPIC